MMKNTYSNYDENYLESRRQHIDVTEWLDILMVLKGLGVKPPAKVVELGAGEGWFTRFLARLGYRVIGYDLLYGDNEFVVKADLNKIFPSPPFDVCISQHFLEHVKQDRVVELLVHCLHHGIAAVNIVPGHEVDDPTHVINHYHPSELASICQNVCRRVGDPCFCSWWPDALSYAKPYLLDWVFVVSKKQVSKPFLYTFLVHVNPRITLAVLKAIAKIYRMHVG